MTWIKTVMDASIVVPTENNIPEGDEEARKARMKERAVAAQETDDPFTSIMGDHVAIPLTLPCFDLVVEPVKDRGKVLETLSAKITRFPTDNCYKLLFSPIMYDKPIEPVKIDLMTNDPEEAKAHAEEYITGWADTLTRNIISIRKSLGLSCNFEGIV